MEVVPFQAEHIAQLELQSAQQYLSNWVTPAQAKALEEFPSFSGVVNGVPVAALGILPQWQGRAIAWGFLSETGYGAFVQIHREVKSFLDDCYVQRIEATVDCDFEQGHRWVQMLGFKLEAERMRAYGPTGDDCALYARVL